MDKEEFRIKLEEINNLVEKKDYKSAMNVVDSIDWRRVKNVRTLSVVGEIYAANKRYEDSKEIFLLAYHRAPIGKNILYRLIEVSLKMKDFEEAMDFFIEYKEVAPNDNMQYVLQYKILSAKKAPLNEQIKVLEEYKEKEFTEKWSYELAKLYYQAGEKDKCLDLCNEMILWFSEGSYVMRAMDLKMRMGALTGEEKEKYEKAFTPSLKTPEDLASEEQEEQEKAEEKKEYIDEASGHQIESIRIRSDGDLSGVETFQEKISKGIRDIFGGKKRAEDEEEEEDAEDLVQSAPEEIIRTKKSAEETAEPANVPSLEPEGEKPVHKELGASMKMPELNIPDSMKNIDIKDALKVPEIPSPDLFLDDEEETEEEEKKTEIAEKTEAAEEEDQEEILEKDFDFDFNLEETILAAATAQGIEIPKDVKESGKEKKAVKEAAKEPAEVPSLEPEEIQSIEIEEDAVEEEVPEEPELSDEEELEQFIKSIHPEEEHDVLDIIPRAKKLTDEEKKLFTYFVKVPGMKEQIVNALCNAQKAATDSTSRTGNIIVMGGRETGKTRLIASLIPAICSELNMEAAKVAYVFAEQINGKDMFAITEKLSGGFLVIENANQLSPETADQLEKAMNLETEGLFVIVEDEKIGMRKFMARYPRLARKFTSIINIPVFTNDELVNFAKVYTLENGYKVDQMGMLALYNMISISQKQDQAMNIGIVKEIIDNAIMKSQKGLRKKKRVDRDGYIVLMEKDFS